MAKFDPPSDPYGDDKLCRMCDNELVYDDWERVWYCPSSHDEPCSPVETPDDSIGAELATERLD